MQPHATFLDRFTTMFNRGEEELRSENRKKIIGTNNILYSLGGPNAQVENLEADAVHIYGHKKGYYEPELDFLRNALELLNIKYEFHDIEYPYIGYGELPLFRIEFMIFTKERFIEALLKVVFDGSDVQEELAVSGILLLCKELSRATGYYMWTGDKAHYRYRHRHWLLFQPIWRVQEIYGNYKKRVVVAQEGIESASHALEKAKEVLSRLEKINESLGGFYTGNKTVNSLKSHIVDLLVYSYLQEIIRNTVKSDLYELLYGRYPSLKRFAEEFEKNLPAYVGARQAGQPVKIKFIKPDLVHSYKSRYRTVEDIKKEQTNSIFLTVTSVSLILYVFLYYKG